MATKYQPSDFICAALNDQWDTREVNGQLELLTGSNAIKQTIKTRLQMWLGEWVLNIRAGVPWEQNILVHGATLEQIESIFAKSILDTKGVVKLNSLSARRAGSREVTVTFEYTDVFSREHQVEVAG
jgi:hypothetical protein